jgi:hypothetical protein
MKAVFVLETAGWGGDDKIVTEAVPRASSDISSPTKTKGTETRLPIGLVPVLQDYRVNNLPAEDALPTKKMFTISIKFFIDHHSATSITPHMGLLGFVPHASSPVRF